MSIGWGEVSARTREGLAAAKAKGRQLGRPKGIGKSKLDQFKPEIVALIKNGATRSFIATRYKVTPASVGNWLRKRGMGDLRPEP